MLVICTACGGGGNPSQTLPEPAPEKNTPPKVELLGARRIQLLHGANYEDAGAVAHDKQDGDITDKIVTEGLPINTSVAGDYEIRYTVTDSESAVAEVARRVIVSENESPTITLLGANEISVNEGARFVDPGAEASDIEDGELTSKIEVENGVNTEVPGNYKVFYRVSDSAGATASVERDISVIGKPSEYSHIPITIDKEGFSSFQPQSDSKLIYVSSSSGDDFNDGLSPKTAVKSIAKGKELLRDGFPDWLLLKIGDEWSEGLGRWVKSGRSAKQPMIVTSYGTGLTRPLLLTGARSGIRASGGGGSPKQVDYLVFSGLHFYAETRDPDSDSFSNTDGASGIVWLRGSTYLLIEDNCFDHYQTGIAIMDISDLNVSGVEIRKNVIVDSFSTDGHSQGIYIQETEGVTIEENIFDHNGWHESLSGAQATKFNHSIYIQGDNLDVQIKNNIISRSSSHGMQLRPGGLIEGNFLIRNPISILLGMSDVSDDDGVVVNNVILNGNDIGSEPRGWGIDFKPENNGVIKNNIVAHVLTDSGNRFGIKTSDYATYSGNVVYDWEEIRGAQENYVDPKRTIEEYNVLMGGEATFDSFVEKIRAQSRLDWNPDYSTESLNRFFREGFSPKE
ncbi:DUF5011 domain-containing protein [Microbulbifer bruguierae]|uniref:DUF5011 domain-containing protein n=1 Tax=Microbulbifer bruguierae TaxID=3029061 RepID=A0ABY8N8M6_9GAMM|nr:immunoglobulin-like domain-containing protein [Microbulbifer bruguierae]WGL15248.1 DUF5011 domain-containing protein [Microbulbifer bruguierae]